MFIHMISDILEPFTPPSLRDTADAVTLMLRVPTPAQREQLSARLLALGLTYVSEQRVRMTVIDELWSLYPEEEAEQKANALDSVWQRELAQQMAFDRWSEQEVQRVLDERAGAPERPAEDLPPRIIGVREQARAQLLYDEVCQTSPRVRDLIAERMDFARKNATLLVRIGVSHIEGFAWGEDQEIPGILNEAQAQEIQTRIGESAWGELVGRIDSMYSLGEEEEKNSDLPPERPSDPTGSPAPSAGSENSGGPWMDSPTGPAPTDASVTTIGTSSPGV